MSNALCDAVYNVNANWQNRDKHPDFKEIPGYQMWRYHYRNVKPTRHFMFEGFSFFWMETFLKGARKDADNAAQFQRVSNLMAAIGMDTIPSRNTAFAVVPITRQRSTESYVHDNFNWNFVVPRNQLITQWNASVFDFSQVTSAEIARNGQESANWFHAFPLKTGKPATSKAEEDNDLKAFKSLLFMATGLWCPVDETKMRKASQRLRELCNNCPIMKLFNQVYHCNKNPEGHTCCAADELDENKEIQLEMLNNKMMTDHVIIHYIIQEMNDSDSRNSV